MTRIVLVLAAVAALVVAGCTDDSATPRARSDDGGDARVSTVERTTRVEVVKHLGGDSGFDPEEIFRRDGPGVVTIRSIFGKNDDGTPDGGVGSGFVVSGDGEVVTNAHVVSQGEGADISRADEVYVNFADNNQVPAKILGLDPNADVALIRLQTRAGLTLRPLSFGSSERVEVGEPVAALGSPFGEEQSLSVGIVSATGRAIDSLTGFQTLGAIQTDAAINPGNSGGPLIDSKGNVIGINAQIRTNSGGGEGVGYAIPADQVTRSLDQLRATGSVKYPYVGVSTSPVYPQLADRFDLGVEHGAWIQEIVKGGPADKGGLRAGSGKTQFQAHQYAPGGDVITKVGDRRVTTSDDVGLALLPYKPGDTVDIEIVRDGRPRTLTIRLGERPAQIDRPG